VQKAVCYYIYFSFKFRGIKVNYKQYITLLFYCFNSLSTNRQQFPQTLDKVGVVGVVRKNHSALNATHHNMVQQIRNV